MCPKPFQHSDWRNFGGERFSETAVVTSGALARYPTPSGLMPCAEATLLFYDEVNNFNWSWSRQRFSDFPRASLPLEEAAGTTTHFTATVWAASERVGCGVARCPGGEVYTVCHYAPGGNYFECFRGADGQPDCNSFAKNVFTTACQNATGDLGSGR
ncbi:SCP super family [Chlorella sorokiniana]|uniref:SCP super family n=1 Tax=Chlorella sorokiniana TaxID=3076 RepID=A0A2P6U5K9_CHLSO|nr:SCP super family [Chlorella sorokiniana]|eukprot:PRW61608.1 SCP super family [Chlorella sorokiniana]